jgi:large subunit ribosomal protein L17
MPKTVKLGRKKDVREALIKSLTEALIEHGAIQTTLPKAKAVVRYLERLLTYAKRDKNRLHNRRMVIASLHTKNSAHRLVDEIAPKLASKTSGHLKIEKLGRRSGDNAPLAKVSFVDDIKTSTQSEIKDKDQNKDNKKTPEKEKTVKTAPQVIKDKDSKIQPKPIVSPTTKRSGVRGNR